MPPITITGGSRSLENGALSVATDASVVPCALIFGAAAILQFF
ncbi:hypothetical protein SLEP1_g24047 [Rubroshorea leprosula]|uniref:Uncharacterized protein n=1 Tax=Rubroshorea leprosula TaxID=152421 RepID=A0AAV5JEK4_9ROSI|nr:hypothetical protein SLEP1_g24047 [Rubroshorea leprosula]